MSGRDNSVRVLSTLALKGAIARLAGAYQAASGVAIDADDDFVDLPPQLRRVLELYAAGESTAGVAKSMNLSPDTVSDYVGRIRTKYAAVGRPAPTRQHLMFRAIEDGWLPIPRRLRRRS